MTVHTPFGPIQPFDIPDTGTERPVPRKHRGDRRLNLAVARIMRADMGLPPHPALANRSTRGE